MSQQNLLYSNQDRAYIAWYQTTRKIYLNFKLNKNNFLSDYTLNRKVKSVVVNQNSCNYCLTSVSKKVVASAYEPKLTTKSKINNIKF